MSKKDKLFTEFPPVSLQEWENNIQKDLKGANYKNKLNWQTGEGIEILPFYRADDFEELPPPLLSGSNDWEIRQPVTEQNIEKANDIAQRAIEGGADALVFKLETRPAEGNLGGDLHGTAIQSQKSFNQLVDGINISQTALHFDASMASPVMLAMLHNACEEQGIDGSAVRGSVLFDPYAFVITKGQQPKEEAAFIADARQLVEFCTENLPGVKPLGVDGRPYHQAGGTLVQELGYALATGSEYIATLSDAGLKPNTIASAIHFNFSIGSNYFLEIAKFRAARKLWHKILDAYGVEDHHQAYLHGSSSAWNKTMYDPYINMLRTTTEGMSAAIAGCDSITLHPFDETFEQPDDFSRRIARNVQTLLKEEAYFNKVTDPAAGSYYIEKLTNKIAEAAWGCFQKVEQQGGILKSIQDGYVQTAVEESREQRDRAIATRGRTFVGINQYPNMESRKTDEQVGGKTATSLKESDKEADIEADQLMSSLKKALQLGCSLGDIIPEITEIKKYDIRPIRPYRGAQAFEALRQATEYHSAAPKVLTLPMGNKKMRKTRSAFTKNFFGCAGYDIEDPIGFDSVDEAITEITKQQPDIVVLCSSDDEYKKLVPELCDQLDQKLIIVLAGYPKEYIDEYRAAGIDAFIHAKSNVLETLQEFQQKLGIIKNET